MNREQYREQFYPTLDAGVPIPAFRGQNAWLPQTVGVKRRIYYPWKLMKIGDSFFVPGGGANSIRAASCSYRKRICPESYFIVHLWREKDVNGNRVWRVK